MIMLLLLFMIMVSLLLCGQDNDIVDVIVHHNDIVVVIVHDNDMIQVVNHIAGGNKSDTALCTKHDNKLPSEEWRRIDAICLGLGDDDDSW